ncbi:hypothetical protein [Tropicimonas isoalkanivorans]|uniref:Uncharacterized protein n=1 Tax=Tropicimonas isoalkanivorans TaxID=441112 RepID=A0A1I1DMY1_9RHOB|nr:hypothetical protein [Tropicimonas isoalkanivorans]SFB76355.1 hypothetical protein SAMN04488094_101365 [Tropicimonas isoalkanivorans]
MSDSLTLSPLTATVLLLVLVFAGRAFRQNWKAQGAFWRVKAWAYGLAAVIAFAALAFLQVQA